MSKFAALKQLSEEHQKLIEAHQEKVKEAGQPAIEEGLREFFAANPKIEAIRWTQYTPHFNDGEACTFSVHEPYIKIQGAEIDEDDDEDGDGFQYNAPPDLEDAFSKLTDDLMNLEDELEIVFGDHARITVTRAGEVEIEEYEHD